MSIIPLCMIVLAALCAFIALPLPVSKMKGKLRSAGSLFLGAGFILMGVEQVTADRRYWLLVLGGAFLLWIGLRKFRRDPEGRTRAEAIL